MQNFTHLSFSAAEKSVFRNRTKKTKTHSKLSIPHTTVWWDNKEIEVVYISRRAYSLIL